MIRKALLSASVLYVMLGTLVAQGTQIEFEKYQLDNGLTVILHQDNSTPNVITSVMYHVGSKNENPERTGFAHFFEHLLFEGSENIGRGEYASYVQNVGGELNANTSFDRTFYYDLLPSNQLELGLWLESERMLHAKVENEGIETQRQVVREERRERIDNQPYGSILEETFKRTFPEHPYGWGIIGSMDHLAAATEEDYKQFYADFYVPNNAILSVAGNFKKKEAKALIEKYFGTIPKGKGDIRRPKPGNPMLANPVRDTIYDNIQLPAVVMAYGIPAQGTKEAYAVEMLSTLLSTGQSSRLYRKLVDEEQLALFVGSFPLALEHPSVSLAFGITNMGISPSDVEAGIEAEIARAQNELMSEKEFQKLRNQIEAEFITRNGRIAGVAESLANYEMYYGDANLINTELERYMAVTREDIRDAARKYFTKDNRVVLMYLPKSQAPKP